MRVLCPDGWPAFDGLVDVGHVKYMRINKQKSFTNGRAHINGIEACWSFTKRRLAKFNGVKVNFDFRLEGARVALQQIQFLLFKNLLTLLRNPRIFSPRANAIYRPRNIKCMGRVAEMDFRSGDCKSDGRDLSVRPRAQRVHWLRSTPAPQMPFRATYSIVRQVGRERRAHNVCPSRQR